MKYYTVYIIIITTLLNLFANDFKEFRFTTAKIQLLHTYDITKFIQNEGDIIALKTDAHNHLYINFSTSPKIYKFELLPKFKFLTFFNKEGNGPGEMIAPITFGVIDDRICVTDKNGIRLNVFDLKGNLINFYNTINTNRLILYKIQQKVYGFRPIPAKYFNELQAPYSLYLFQRDGETLIPKNSCCPLPAIGSYLVNQISDFILVNDSLLFVSFKYLDRIIRYNLNRFSYITFGSPAKMHLKSPTLGQTSMGKKKFAARLTGKEYSCFRNIFQFSPHLMGAFFWGKQPKSFSYVDIFKGNIGGRLIHFFNLNTGAYLFSIKLPFKLSHLVYSKTSDLWIGLKGNLHEIVIFKIEGIQR